MIQQHHRKVVSVPDILNINCQLERDINLKFWKKQIEVGSESFYKIDKFRRATTHLLSW